MANIYLSSTFLDLKDCRARIYRALRKLEHDVKAMEDYVAQDARPLDRCLADVAACDIYIGIFAWRYGYIPDDPLANPDRRCVTELEFRAAQQARKPCLIFVLDERAPWVPEMMDSQTGEGDRGERIRGLRAEVEKSLLVSKFHGCDELEALASIAVTQQIGKRSPFFTAAQQFRQVTDHVLLACSEIDRPIADAWTAEIARAGLRVRLATQALLSERESDFVQLERDAEPQRNRDSLRGVAGSTADPDGFGATRAVGPGSSDPVLAGVGDHGSSRDAVGLAVQHGGGSAAGGSAHSAVSSCGQRSRRRDRTPVPEPPFSRNPSLASRSSSLR